MISTQSPPPRPFSVTPPPKLSLSLVNSSPNCQHKLIVASDGWRGARDLSVCRWPPIAIASLSSNRNCRHLIIVVQSSSSSSMTSTLTPSSLSLLFLSPPSCSTFPSSLLPSPPSLPLASLSRCCRRHRHRRSSSSCLSCSLAVNPRNSTKASQGGITHGMGMERLPLDLP